MPYRFAVENLDHTDLASGRVLYALAGQPSLSVRLADEVYRRCMAHRQVADPEIRATLYDPCCGVGYQLAVVGLLHAGSLRQVIGSDILPSVVDVARRNLSLLSLEGLDRRMGELLRLETAFGKASHREARESAARLRDGLAKALTDRHLDTQTFVCDVLSRTGIEAGLSGARPDIVIADVPYGLHAEWAGESLPEESDTGRVRALLEALRGSLLPGCVVGIVANKSQKVAHTAYQQLERFQIGKRRAVILRLNHPSRPAPPL